MSTGGNSELTERLQGIEAVAGAFVGVEQLEHLLSALLMAISDEIIPRRDVVPAFEQLATDWPLGAVECLEFCLRDLQWPEMREVLDHQARTAEDFRHRRLAQQVLETYQDTWPGGEIYRRYRAAGG